MNFLLFFVFSLDINIKALFSLKLETFFRNVKDVTDLSLLSNVFFLSWYMSICYIELCNSKNSINYNNLILTDSFEFFDYKT